MMLTQIILATVPHATANLRNCECSRVMCSLADVLVFRTIQRRIRHRALRRAHHRTRLLTPRPFLRRTFTRPTRRPTRRPTPLPTTRRPARRSHCVRSVCSLCLTRHVFARTAAPWAALTSPIRARVACSCRRVAHVARRRRRPRWCVYISVPLTVHVR
jgi:hypothetical protein